MFQKQLIPHLLDKQFIIMDNAYVKQLINMENACELPFWTLKLNSPKIMDKSQNLFGQNHQKLIPQKILMNF